MKNLAYIFIVLFFAACQAEDSLLDAPSDVANVTAEPRVGAALVSWEIPADSNYLYLDITYDKFPDNPDTSEIIRTQASKYTDTLLVEGLLNKYEYTFSIQAHNETPDEKVGGSTLTTDSVRPVRRAVDIMYYPDELTKIEGITPDMLDTYTQESSEGPKENLIDGDINTYWHSAWSSGVAPLPHWIQVNFEEVKSMGAIKYHFRQSADPRGRPNQFALETSEDGANWVRQWTSDPDLPVEPASEEQMLDFGQNFEAKHYRILILSNPGNVTFTHLGEISFHTMKVEEVDLEEIAEENY